MLGGFLRGAWRRLYPVVDFVLPADCFVCRAPLGPLAREGACHACWGRLTTLGTTACPGCALPAPVATDLARTAGGRCPACPPGRPPWSAVRAAVAYDDVARALLLRLKSRGCRELAAPLADQLAAAARTFRRAAGWDTIVPAPSHPGRDLWRGFSPSRELARHLGRVLRTPVVVPLRRTDRFRRPGAGGVSRRAARTRSIVIGRRTVLRGRVLLVDDVMTTGATLRRCAALLLDSGASEVIGLVWARALPAGWEIR